MAASDPRISVLIPVWNNAETLGRAVDSILAQTFEELEVLVLDDGSTDSSREVAAAYRDARVRPIALPHRGISLTLNAGLDDARAPFVAIHDADDWSLPERLERQLAVLESDRAVGVVGCRMREVDERGRTRRSRIRLAVGDVTDRLLRFNSIPGSAAALRRDVALSVGGFDPRYRSAQDYDLWLRIADHHRVVCLPDELAVRWHGEGNVGARKARQQVGESISLKVATMRRRRSLRGVWYLPVTVLAWVLPVRLRRAVRRLRGRAAY
jgi:glycosyltransferase involved in cell wall biosynthesis